MADALETAAQFGFTQQMLRDLAQTALDHAAKNGATACEVDVSESVGQSVSVRRQEVDTIEYNRDKGLGVTVYLGQRRGHASSSDFSPAAVKETVAAALAIARYTAADDCAGLPDAKLLAKKSPDLDLFHPWDVQVPAAIDLAKRCEQAALDVSPLITNSEGATVGTQQAHFISANSLGFMDGYASTQHYVSCSVIAGEGEGMQRDSWYTASRDAARLSAVDRIGDYTARRALARLGSRKLSTRKCPVIFEAPLAIGLIGNLTHAISGGALYRKTSFLQNSLGQKIFPDFVSISERPHLKGGMASSAFDSDGVATHDRELVQNGVLQGYLLSTYSARKLGMQTTGNAGGAHNLLVTPGKHDFAGLLREMGTGLLVTELMGQGVNYLTGDYSRGAAGYWVENGVIVYPVAEITIAGNLREMFAGIVDIGKDIDLRGGKRVGSILLGQMTVAGN
ncbi:MAG: metalloprotease PmbA [Rugosibacter sp.]